MKRDWAATWCMFTCLLLFLGLLGYTLTAGFTGIGEELRRQTAIMERWVPPEALETVEQIEPERIEE